jgi:hypothetical protein
MRKSLWRFLTVGIVRSTYVRSSDDHVFIQRFFIYIHSFCSQRPLPIWWGRFFFIQLGLLFFDLDFPPLIKLNSQLFICTNALQLMK